MPKGYIIARVTVTDDGPGVALSDLGLIYRKYGRADRSHTGSGLGLYLARGPARAHGGDIHYRREQPGSAFTLTLPRPRRGDLTAQPVSRRSDGCWRGSARPSEVRTALACPSDAPSRPSRS